MSSTRRTVIDVGTNSVKVLVADVEDGIVQPVFEDSEQTRLGAGFFETRKLQPGTIAHTARAVADFATRGRKAGAQSTRVIATSAAREALNAAELVKAIHDSAGLGVEIISGEQEADWAYKGVTSDSALAHQPLVLMDLGGGSTEFIVGKGASKHFRQSFQLGSVRLQERFAVSDPPPARQLAECRSFVSDFLNREIRPQLAPALERQPGSQLVGVGGTATILARMAAGMENYDRGMIEAQRISFERVVTRVEHLWSLPLAERQRVPGLPANRADVILMGVVVYEQVMNHFGFADLRVSTRGLRFAALM
jgi:exopolyphosphatase / guanosine-5'-triphosphate,3'-diphosphate pyrophosphatase